MQSFLTSDVSWWMKKREILKDRGRKEMLYQVNGWRPSHPSPTIRSSSLATLSRLHSPPLDKDSLLSLFLLGLLLGKGQRDLRTWFCNLCFSSGSGFTFQSCHWTLVVFAVCTKGIWNVAEMYTIVHFWMESGRDRREYGNTGNMNMPNMLSNAIMRFMQVQVLSIRKRIRYPSMNYAGNILYFIHGSWIVFEVELAMLKEWQCKK